MLYTRKSKLSWSRIEERHTLRLVQTALLVPEVYLMEFEVLSETAFEYHPGQWMVFRPEDGNDIFLSLASSVGSLGRNRIEIALRDYGEQSGQQLLKMAPGTTLTAWGPSGGFPWTKSLRAPAAFIGTGTGLTPFRAMLQAALTSQGPLAAPLVVLAGHRDESRVLWRNEFETWAATHPHLTYSLTLSHPSHAWQGRTGYVQDHLLDLMDTSNPQEFYLCGHTPMVQQVREMLVERHGISAKKIYTELTSAEAALLRNRVR